MKYMVGILTGLLTVIVSHANPLNVSKAVDGTPFGINGPQIRKLLYIRQEVGHLMEGFMDAKTKIRTGMYTLLGQQHSVSSLAKFENEAIQPHERQELQTLLHKVLEDFIKIVKPFIEQGRGAKSITVSFIKEWSENHARENTLLLSWAQAKDGHEFDILKEQITSFATLGKFCQDLLSFIADLITSCPRGWQQFLELQQKSKK